jgi:hypothetical protein
MSHFSALTIRRSRELARPWAFYLHACARVALGFLLAGCGHRDSVQIKLLARVPPGHGGPNLQITAQIAGRQDGLRYKWFSVSGGCDPQSSDNPETAFRFADGTMRDRISVEAWRGNKMVGQGQVDVKLDENQARLLTIAQSELAQIEITKIPPSEPKGGSETHADIAGKVMGKVEPGYTIVLYARASQIWYIQPAPDTALSIGPDNTWTGWTHTGSSYAALLVRPGFEPIPRLDLLPQVGGFVLARNVVDGASK